MDKGIVERIENGVIEIRLLESDEEGCADCKIQGCSRAAGGTKTLVLRRNADGFSEGDRVTVEIGAGKRVLWYSLVYLLPVAGVVAVFAGVAPECGETAGSVAAGLTGAVLFVIASVVMNAAVNRTKVRRDTD
jgi:positive regulator of sigma E activity